MSKCVYIISECSVQNSYWPCYTFEETSSLFVPLGTNIYQENILFPKVFFFKSVLEAFLLWYGTKDTQQWNNYSVQETKFLMQEH